MAAIRDVVTSHLKTFELPCKHNSSQRKQASSNVGHYGVIYFKPEKNLEFFRLKNDPIDGSPGKLE